MVGVRVPDPHEGAHGLNLAVVEESGTDAEDGVAVANDARVGEVNGATEVESVAGAGDIDAVNDIPRAGDKQSFSLAVEVVGDGESTQDDAGGVVGGKRAATGGAGHGRVEAAVVAVADLHLVAVFAFDGDVGLVAEEDDLFVVAVANEDDDAMAWCVGDEVDRALHGGEVARAIG